jgi:hypothetical protein
MTDPTSPPAGTPPESIDTSATRAGEGVPLTRADLLAETSAADHLLADAVMDGLAALPTTPETPGAVADMDKLNLSDVLPGPDATDPNLGVYLTVETVNGNTVVSVDCGGLDSAPAVAIVTLEGVAGLTLQQLLQNDSGVS